MIFQKLYMILKLGRLHFVAAGLLLFIVGILLSALSGAKFSVDKFILGYAVLFTGQLAVSYSNDFFDLQADRFNTPTLFSGGSGVLLEDPDLISFAKWFSIFLMALSAILAGAFIALFSYSLLLLAYVVLANFVGWFYSAPPARLAYRGLGEAATTIVIGILIPGWGFLVLNGHFNFDFLIFAFPLLLYGFVFIISVEIPDMEADRLAGKKTLIAQKGCNFGFMINAILLSLATIYFLGIFALQVPLNAINPGIIAVLSLIPAVVGLLGLIRHSMDDNSASKGSFITISSLFLFLLLVNSYLLFLLE
ncbi:MAG: prenyltransferase [Candidatus Heimdallarchaeota archaeon]